MNPEMRAETLTRFIALHGVRNTELENLHAGHWPAGAAHDGSDVRVVGPGGEIAWADVSRISEPEMRVLMLSIEAEMQPVIRFILSLVTERNLKRLDRLVEVMRDEFFPPYGDITWDLAADRWDALCRGDWDAAHRPLRESESHECKDAGR